MEITKERIAILIDNYVAKTFGSNFEYRPQQREVIVDIIKTFLDGVCNLYLLDAPTGSGKSIIAMIVAGFLEANQMKGYILASDLTLQSQYEKDIKYRNFQWGSIKGVDNYDCIINHEKFSLGECRIKNISYADSEKKPCFQDCGYLYGRKIAIKSNVSLLNYSYWLIQRNYVEPKMIEKGTGIPFPKRDFTLCDEAHKVSEIVQNHFSPKIDIKTADKLEDLRKFLEKNKLSVPYISMLSIKTNIKNIFKEEDQNILYSHLKKFENALLSFVVSSNSIKEYVATKFKDVEVPKAWKFALGLSDWVKDMHCKYEDYNSIIQNAGIQNLIKNTQGEQIIFNCLDESYMMDKHFHTQAGFKLLMTATMGDSSIFLKTIGAKDARYFKMDSFFDYQKSPIYFYPSKRMSMAHKEKNFPWLIEKVNEILEYHPNEKGIIHSGSYEISARILNGVSEENKKRLLTYQGTKEKELALENYIFSENSFLIGPSLLEGLDLASDKSRVQIFLKVPFPSLGDKLVSAKMNFQPEWYDWKTSCGILQGIGRSVRNEKDWCVTYFLDGCLSDLFRRSRSNFPNEFQKRIVVEK